MPTQTPTLLIGLDGATFDVLEPLAAAGDLPVLADLMARGAWGPLRSVVPPITPTAWSSFMTGKEPGKHGIFDFRLYDPARAADRFISSQALTEPTMWELLRDAGLRVGVVGLPMMYPPSDHAAVVVSGFDTPSTSVPFTHPPELQARILARFPDYQFVASPPAEDVNVETDAGFEQLVSDAERSFEQRTAVALDLLAEAPFDVLMVHYQDTDAMQHRVWRFIEDPRKNPARWARLRQCYARLDRHLGELGRAMPDDTLVVVLSDHGFGSLRGHVFPNVLLQQWGYLDWTGRRMGKLRRSIRKRLVRFGLAEPEAARGGPWVAEQRTRHFDRVLPLRWERTRAYVALGHSYGHLFVNQRGREPNGIVEPGARDALLSELAARFADVRDPVTSTPVIAAVLRGEDVYPADRFARRPDLVLVPADGFEVSRQLNYKMSVARYASVGGSHRMHGIFIATGPGIRAGAFREPLGIMDVAPTVLARHGVGIPDDVDGRVAGELFVEVPAARFVSVGARAAGTDAGLSEDEEEIVAARLRALGYTE
jgi:predicted AlkP superfamily phosphohydrolase/phosphomutase